MKIFLISCFIVFVLCDGSSQNVNVARQSYMDDVYHLVSIGSRHFYIEHVTGGVMRSESTQLLGIDHTGKSVFKLAFGSGASTRIIKNIQTSDHCLLLISSSTGCDFDFGPSQQITKVDTNGVILFQKNVPGDGFSDYVSDGLQSGDSSFYLLSDTALLHFNKSGDHLSSLFHGLLETSSMALRSNGNFIVNGYDSTFNYFTLELLPNGSLLRKVSSPNYSTIIEDKPTGNLYCRNGNRIDKLDPTLLPIANSAATNLRINTFFIMNDSLFFAGCTSSSTPVFGLLNKDLNLLYSSQTNLKNVYPTGLSRDKNNRINIIANACSLTNPAGLGAGSRSIFTTFHSFPLTGNFTSPADVGVEKIKLLKAEKTPYNNILNVNLSVAVKNYSNDTVKNFCLNSRAMQQICGFMQFQKNYTVSIPPMASISVETGPFFNTFLGTISTGDSILISQKVCFYTSIPNQQADNNIDNDAVCSFVLLSDTIVERSAPDDIDYLSLYPNPFADELTIRSGTTIEKVEIYNSVGQAIRIFDVYKKFFSIHEFNVSTGVYIIRLTKSNGSVVKKLIKQ